MKEELSKIVKKYQQTSVKVITSNTDLTNDLLIDSLSMVDLVMEIEDSFGISISDSEIGEINTFKDLENCVATLIEQKGDK